MDRADPYDTLAVNPGADDDEIRRAYRIAAKNAHPDHGGTAESFRRVREAYDRIATADRRNAYAATVRPAAAPTDRGTYEPPAPPFTTRGETSDEPAMAPLVASACRDPRVGMAAIVSSAALAAFLGRLAPIPGAVAPAAFGLGAGIYAGTLWFRQYVGRASAPRQHRISWWGFPAALLALDASAHSFAALVGLGAASLIGAQVLRRSNTPKIRNRPARRTRREEG